MKKNRKIKSISIMIVSILFVALLSGHTIAYFLIKSNVNKDFTIGEIKIDVVASNELNTSFYNNMKIDDIVYVDYEKDIMKNESSNLDLVATYFDITITNKSNVVIPTDLEATFKFKSAQEADSLIFIIIPIDDNFQTNYYDTYLKPIYDNNTSIDTFKNALYTYNNQTIDNNNVIFNLKNNYNFNIDDSLQYRVVLFTDYNVATDTTKYGTSLESSIHSFSHSYLFDVDINLKQHV